MVTIRVGLGYDVHPFDAERSLVLGGVHLDGPGLRGHSDADAVAHAVSDAVLGPAGLPDLGTLFPASDERWKGADSMALLGAVAERAAAERWSILNVDVVIVAETPQLGPHTAAMAANLVAVLGAAHRPMGDPVHVGVKAKRGEGLGAIGRAEGIAVHAVALLEWA